MGAIGFFTWYPCHHSAGPPGKIQISLQPKTSRLDYVDTQVKRWIFVISSHLTTLQICLCAGICLSHLNSYYASIAIAPNGFHCSVIAEHTHSYGVKDSLFLLCAAESLSSVLQFLAASFDFIFLQYCKRFFLEAYSFIVWLEVRRDVSKANGGLSRRRPQTPVLHLLEEKILWSYTYRSDEGSTVERWLAP